MGELVTKLKAFMEARGASFSTNNEAQLESGLEYLDLGVDLQTLEYPSMKEMVAKRKRQFAEQQKKLKELEKASRDYKKARKQPGKTGYSTEFEQMVKAHEAKQNPEASGPPEPAWWALVPGLPVDGTRDERWKFVNKYWNSLDKEGRARLGRKAEGKGKKDTKLTQQEIGESYPSMVGAKK